MVQAEPASSTNPSVELTRKGERFAAQEAARREAVATKKALRREAAAEVELLLSILDRLDGDPDLEPDGTEEPDLGWEGGQPGRFAGGNDSEPTYGWTGVINQTSRNRLGASDSLFDGAEKDDADREPDVDDEPSLSGWDGYAHPRSRADTDLEEDPAEKEPGLGWTDAEAATGVYPEMHSIVIDGEVDDAR